MSESHEASSKNKLFKIPTRNSATKIRLWIFKLRNKVVLYHFILHGRPVHKVTCLAPACCNARKWCKSWLSEYTSRFCCFALNSQAYALFSDDNPKARKRVLRGSCSANDECAIMLGKSNMRMWIFSRNLSKNANVPACASSFDVSIKLMQRELHATSVRIY